MTEGKKNHFIKEMGNPPIYRKLEKVWVQVPQWGEKKGKKRKSQTFLMQRKAFGKRKSM